MRLDFFSGSPRKSKVCHFQTRNLDFPAVHPKFHLALEPKVLKLGESFLGAKAPLGPLQFVKVKVKVKPKSFKIEGCC